MRIAVPTNDGRNVSEHFGRCAAFLVFEIEDGEVRGCETRANPAHRLEGAGDCSSHGHAPHSHADLVSTLADCAAVVCGGMGRRAADALTAAGIAAVVAPPAGSAQDAVLAFARGELRPDNNALCRCSH